jgi:hypothetical protein
MTKRLIILRVISILMLLWALYPDNPYGYYILLRFAVFASCGFMAFKSYRLKKENWALILAGVAVVYNPFIRVHFTRDIWSGINILTAILLTYSIREFRPKSIHHSSLITHHSP